MYINGGILIGAGLGPLVFGLFSYNFLNPDKLTPMDGYYEGTADLVAIAEKVPELLQILALMYLCIGLLGAIFLLPVCL